MRLRNSKQLFHNQTVLMTSHSFDFDAVTHSINDVSVSARQSLAPSELFWIHGYIADKSLLKNLNPNFVQVPEQSEFT